MKIEKVKKNEIDILVPFWEAQVALHHQVDPSYTSPVTPVLSQAIYELLENSLATNYYEIYAAKLEQEIIGFVAFRFDKTNHFYTKMNNYGEIYNILVKDPYVRQGVGKKLMTFAEDKMRENKISYGMLVANPHNTNGCGFYQHLGYVPRQSQFFKKIRDLALSINNEVEIVPLATNHITQLLILWQQQIEFHYEIDKVYGAPLSPDVTRILSRKIDEIIRNVTSHTLLVALKAGEVVGFIDYDLKQCEHYYTPIKKYGQIFNLFVEQNNRKKGIGQALVAEAEKVFLQHHMDYAMLWAMPENRSATQFYNQLGYQCKQVQMFKDLNDI